MKSRFLAGLCLLGLAVSSGCCCFGGPFPVCDGPACGPYGSCGLSCGTSACDSCPTPCGDPCGDACGSPCASGYGPFGPYCWYPGKYLMASLFCCDGCGPLYWHEWFNDPPDCCDPCGSHGEWIGQAHGIPSGYEEWEGEIPMELSPTPTPAFNRSAHRPRTAMMPASYGKAMSPNHGNKTRCACGKIH